MKTSLALLSLLFLVACAHSARVPASDPSIHNITDCEGSTPCLDEAKQMLQKSRKIWQSLGLRNYSYSYRDQYFDEPPECADAHVVYVEQGKPVRFDTLNCRSQQREVYKLNKGEWVNAAGKKLEYPTPLTVDESYDHCYSVVLNSDRSHEKDAFIDLLFDRKGVLQSCTIFIPYWGEFFGGDIKY